MAKRIAKTLSILEVVDMFSTEDKAVEWYEQKRWNGKPRCPRCKKTDRVKGDSKRKYNYHCNECRQRFTVKIGTVMHGSNVPVRKWLIAMYLVLTARKGISSLQLSKEIGVTQKTAWYMSHRLREACKGELPKLSGEIEIDETYIGGLEKNKHGEKRTGGRGPAGKTAVIGMRERQGRVRAMPLQSVDKASTHRFVTDNAEKGSQLYTDDARHWTKGVEGYKHEAVKHSVREFVYGMAHTNGIESVWAVLKRGYNGTFHQMSGKHLGRYVDEFSFRLNEGSCQIDTIDRMTSLAKATEGKRITYEELTR